MGQIDQASQTYQNNGVTVNAKTGQPVAPTTPAPATGTPIPAAPLTYTSSPTGKDVFGNPVQGMQVPSADAISRSIDPTTASTPDPNTPEGFLDTFKAPKTEQQIADEMRTASRAQIDSINKVADDEYNRTKQEGDKRLDETNAISVLTGNSGGSEAGHSRDVTVAANDKELAAVNNKRSLDLQAVYTKISQDARAEAQKQVEDATANAKDIIARKKDVATTALNNLKTMASTGGVDFEAFKTNPQNADVYKHALDAVGGSEEALRATFLLNRPQDTIIGTPQRIGDKYVQAYKNPLTGKVSYENITLPFDLPASYTSFQKMGDNLVAIPDNWDGDTSKLKTIIGQPSQADQLDMAYKRAQISKIYSDIQQTSGSGAATQLAPYLNTSASGVPYVDLSAVTGSDKNALAQIAARNGAKVIFNPNTAADLDNIKNAYSNLDTISETMKSLTSPSAFQRFLIDKHLHGLEAMFQTDPQKAAAHALNDSALDLLKAISGTQGFRGNQAAINQIKDSLPTITDTTDTAAAKLKNVRALISNREDALVGAAHNAATTQVQASSDLKAKVAAQGYDYDKMRADGHSDAEIKASLGL